MSVLGCVTGMCFILHPTLVFLFWRRGKSGGAGLIDAIL